MWTSNRQKGWGPRSFELTEKTLENTAKNSIFWFKKSRLKTLLLKKHHDAPAPVGFYMVYNLLGEGCNRLESIWGDHYTSVRNWTTSWRSVMAIYKNLLPKSKCLRMQKEPAIADAILTSIDNLRPRLNPVWPFNLCWPSAPPPQLKRFAHFSQSTTSNSF